MLFYFFNILSYLSLTPIFLLSLTVIFLFFFLDFLFFLWLLLSFCFFSSLLDNIHSSLKPFPKTYPVYIIFPHSLILFFFYINILCISIHSFFVLSIKLFVHFILWFFLSIQIYTCVKFILNYPFPLQILSRSFVHFLTNYQIFVELLSLHILSFTNFTKDLSLNLSAFDFRQGQGSITCFSCKFVFISHFSRKISIVVLHTSCALCMKREKREERTRETKPKKTMWLALMTHDN